MSSSSSTTLTMRVTIPSGSTTASAAIPHARMGPSRMVKLQVLGVVGNLFGEITANSGSLPLLIDGTTQEQQRSLCTFSPSHLVGSTALTVGTGVDFPFTVGVHAAAAADQTALVTFMVTQQ